MENGYLSLRGIEKSCKTDVRYMWLLDEMKAPTFVTIGNFIREDLICSIKNILKLPCFANLENTKIYKEFEFIYDEEIEQEGNKINKTRHGIIDLLVEYNDHFDIIDYKTNNIDKDEYVTQLNGYRKYLEKIIRSSGKEKYVKMYLVSLVQGKQKEVPVV